MHQYENLIKMNLKGKQAIGMDVVIISTSHSQLAAFWQNRLEQMRGEIIKPQTYIIAIEEDWPGGAGNGLGTLYAFQKARQKAAALYGIDFDRLLSDGASIALYHTAGHGARLFPLTGCEYNDKSAIKLPSLIQNDQFMTLLEAVIKQTAIYAPYRKGRLSVFWGDQLFIPSNPVEYTPDHHIDILAKLLPFPSEQEWKIKEFTQYGFIGRHKGEVQIVDKSDYRTLQHLIEGRKFFIEDGSGLSLGSFSLSIPMLFALLEEFTPDLERKEEKMDSDSFLWMPMTLDLVSYVNAMSKKNISVDIATAHYHRLQRFKKYFMQNKENRNLLGIVDIGADSPWWNYGTTRSYFENNLKLTKNGEESELMRQFFHNPLHQNPDKHTGLIQRDSSSSPELIYQNPNPSPELKIDNNSCVLNCQIRSGHIVNSVLVGVCADHIEVDHCIIINSVAARINARHSLIYHVLEDGDATLPPDSVRADCFLPRQDKIVKMQTTLQYDGQADWKVQLPGNRYSYEELSKMNMQINITETLQKAEEAKKRLSDYILVSLQTYRLG